MKYQIGQQFLIRVLADEPAFNIRIKAINEHNEYCVQRIGHVNQIWLTEQDLETFHKMVDNPNIQ